MKIDAPLYLTNLPLKAWRYLLRFPRMLGDKRLSLQIPVKKDGLRIFSIYDYGETTRWRAFTFESKEPETLRWISTFSPQDQLLDIGANIGLYSLYAASRGINTVALEPDALNYALLNLNIRLNKLGSYITPYLLAAHSCQKFSKFNVSSFKWGGALNSFDNTLDAWGNTYQPVHSQGVFGVPLDDFLPAINFSPSHIKIDVDGNENLILSGATKTLSLYTLQSVLIELDESREDYSHLLELIMRSGLHLQEKVCVSKSTGGKYSTLYNHIFRRKP